jgi:hypothetical protein
MNTDNNYEIEKYAWVDALLEQRALQEIQKNEEKMEVENNYENHYPEWNEDIETGNNINDLNYSISRSFDSGSRFERLRTIQMLSTNDSDDELIPDSSYDTSCSEQEKDKKRIKLDNTSEPKVISMDIIEEKETILDEDDEIHPKRLFSYDEEIEMSEEEESEEEEDDQLSIMSDIEVELLDTNAQIYNNDWVIDITLEDEDIIQEPNNLMLPPAPQIRRHNTSWIVDGRVVFNGNPNGSRTWVDHFVDNIV